MNFHNDHLAYFFTMTTYGTWLPGDDRGWTTKNNGSRERDDDLVVSSKRRMTEAAVIFDETQRQIVNHCITKHCQFRDWDLLACNCRSNHVHFVVASVEEPKIIRQQIKAWCSRKLNEHGPRERIGGRKVGVAATSTTSKDCKTYYFM